MQKKGGRKSENVGGRLQREKDKKRTRKVIYVRERERGKQVDKERGRGEGMRGPVSVSLQFCGVVRQCTRPFAYESGSEERTKGPETCMWRP